MTKKDLAKYIVLIVKHAQYLREDPLHDVLTCLDTLQPVDREQFAKWGDVCHQSTPEKCWTKENYLKTLTGE